jgi:hypothetical protein
MKCIKTLLGLTRTELVSYNELSAGQKSAREGDVFQGEEDIKQFYCMPNSKSHVCAGLPILVCEKDNITLTRDDFSFVGNEYGHELYECQDDNEPGVIWIRLVKSEELVTFEALVKGNIDTDPYAYK